MHPEMMFDIVKLHMEDLRREAAHQRLIGETGRRRSKLRAPFFSSGFGPIKLRSRTA